MCGQRLLRARCLQQGPVNVAEGSDPVGVPVVEAVEVRAQLLTPPAVQVDEPVDVVRRHRIREARDIRHQPLAFAADPSTQPAARV